MAEIGVNNSEVGFKTQPHPNTTHRFDSVDRIARDPHEEYKYRHRNDEISPADARNLKASGFTAPVKSSVSLNKEGATITARDNNSFASTFYSAEGNRDSFHYEGFSSRGVYNTADGAMKADGRYVTTYSTTDNRGAVSWNSENTKVVRDMGKALQGSGTYLVGQVEQPTSRAAMLTNQQQVPEVAKTDSPQNPSPQAHVAPASLKAQIRAQQMISQQFLQR